MAGLAREIWVLTEGRAGDDAQIRLLASVVGERHGLAVRDMPVRLPLAQAIRQRLGALAGVWPALAPWLPDGRRPLLVMAAGGRLVPLLEALARPVPDGPGRTRSIAVGRPWADPARFDLVLSPAQYRLPPAANRVRLAMPLNRRNGQALAEAARSWTAELSALPRPWLGVLAGGPSGSFAFPLKAATALREATDGWAARHGGSVLLSTSPRTPAAVTEILTAPDSGVPAFRYRWRPGAESNPLEAILGGADRVLVTGESASMIAEAVAAAADVAVWPLPARRLSRIAVAIWRAARPEQPAALRASWDSVLRWAADRGLWIPPRDVTYLVSCLRDAGAIVALEAPLGAATDTPLGGQRGDPSDGPGRGRVGAGRLLAQRDLDRALAAVGALLERA